MNESYALIGPKKLFLIGGSYEEYQAFEPSFSQTVDLEDPIKTTNTSMGWTTPIVYGSSNTIFKIADYIPRVPGFDEEQRIVVDTWYRPIYFPPYFYKYFNTTYVI